MSGHDMDAFSGEDGERRLILSGYDPGEDHWGPPETPAEREANKLQGAIDLCRLRSGIPGLKTKPLTGYFTASKRNRPTLVELAASMKLDVDRTRKLVDAVTLLMAKK